MEPSLIARYPRRLMLCLLVLAGTTESYRVLAADTVQSPVRAAAGPGPAAKEESKPDVALPKSELALRQMLTDVNKKIDQVDLSIKQVSLAISNVEDFQEQTGKATSRAEPLSGMADLEAAVKAQKGPEAIEQILQDMEYAFIEPTLFRLDVSRSELGIGSAARRPISKLQERVSEIRLRFLDQLRKSIPPGYGQARGRSTNQSSRIPELTSQDLQAIRDAHSPAKKDGLVKEVRTEITNSLAELNTENAKLNAELSQLSGLRDNINQALEKARKEINELAIYLGLPLFCGTVLLLFLIPVLPRVVHRSGHSEDPSAFPLATLVEISTVLLLTMSILILGLADKLDGPVLGTLLGGISGYVLNRTSRKEGSDGGARGAQLALSAVSGATTSPPGRSP